MGAGQSVQPETDQWIDSEWECLPHSPQTFARYYTLRNTRTGALADEYRLSWPSFEQYSFYLRSFNWRSRLSAGSAVVGSLGLREVRGQGGCGGGWGASVYLQHIGLRLSQIEDIPLADALCLLLAGLEGYQSLYGHAGYFRVEEEQLCIDRGGRVKVWVNSNLSINYPQPHEEGECLRRDETHMVRQLVDVVEANTDLDELPQPSFSVFLGQIRRREGCQVGFERAQVALLDYARMMGMTVPSRIEMALELYQDYCAQPPTNSINIFQRCSPPEQQRQQFGPVAMMRSSQSVPSLRQQQPQPQPQQQPPTQTQQQPCLKQPNPPFHRQSQFQQQPFQPISVYQLWPSKVNPEERGTHETGNQDKQTTVRPSLNAKPQRANLEATTQHCSTVVDESRERSLGESRHGPCSVDQQRARNWMGSSQNIEDNYTQYDFTPFPFNRDTFGLAPHRRPMKESSSSYRVPSSHSSYRVPSSNSSHSPPLRHSHRSRSSRRESVKQGYRASVAASVRQSERALEMAQGLDRYFLSLGEEGALDPEIAADMVRYLAE